MSLLKRLHVELAELKKNPPANCSAGPDKNDMMYWMATIMGPAESPYEGGIFNLSICFSKDYPVRDVNVTGPHPLSVGYLNNEDLNNGIKDEDQDDKVFVHIPASEFVGKLPGIVLEKKKVQTQYNFVFDVHCSVNVAGIDVVTHHPSGFQNQRRLQNNEYHDKTVPKKKWKPFYINYETFIKLKPKDMTEKEFIAACLHSDPQKKYHIPSLSPDLNYLRDLIKTVYG